MCEAGRSGFRSLRTCWEFGWKPRFTELGDREDGLGVEEDTLANTKVTAHGKRYLGHICRIFLGRKSRGTLKAYIVRATTGPLALGPSTLTFGASPLARLLR